MQRRRSWVLFGTTVGIINAFKDMSSAKAAGLSAVAGGISEALVTTAFGLFVAVPAVWAYNIFTNKVEAFCNRDDQFLVRVDRLLHQAEEQQEVTLWEWVGGGGRGEVTSDINVTPMADVMLVLLIIFMVVTPMLQKGISSVELAKTKNPIDMTEADKDDSVLVCDRARR